MNSTCSSQSDLEQILDAVLSAIDEDGLVKTVDEPLERAAGSFEFQDDQTDPTIPLSHDRFLNVVAAFVGHLYRCGLPGAVVLTPEQARAKAVSILDHGYRGQLGDEFYGAFDDARSLGEPGIAFVLATIVAVLKRTQRDRHVQWATTDHIGLLPWQVQRALAAYLVQKWKGVLPAALSLCRSEQLAEYCSDLILAFAESQSSLRTKLQSLAKTQTASNERARS